jgi:hypothetical protein
MAVERVAGAKIKQKEKKGKRKETKRDNSRCL